jgi:replicative DNA helicase
MTRGTHIAPLSVLLARVDAITDGADPHDTIATGFPSLDRILGGGMRRGDLIALGGDVGSGKSALALAVALRAAIAGHQVLFLSGEMSPERILERALAMEGRVRVDDLRGGSMDDTARAAVGAAAMRLRDIMPRIERVPTGGVGEIAELAGESRGLELVVVDSLESLGRGARERQEELAAAMQALKVLALDANLAILATVEVSAAGDERPDRRPRLDDFGALGAVKHHADIVLALFREEMYEGTRGIEGATELLVRKNRNGGIGYVDLYFYSQWMRFEDMLEPDR